MMSSKFKISDLALKIVDLVSVSEVLGKPILESLLNFESFLKEFFFFINNLVDVFLTGIWENDSLLEIFDFFELFR